MRGCPWSVTTYTPMKRGLKALREGNILDTLTLVTTYTPMKRGLKGTQEVQEVNQRSSYNLYPDEKGTERTRKLFIPLATRLGYNLYPDEKGTESRKCRKYNRKITCVTTYTPMKRGLKVPSILLFCCL